MYLILKVLIASFFFYSTIVFAYLTSMTNVLFSSPCRIEKVIEHLDEIKDQVTYRPSGDAEASNADDGFTDWNVGSYFSSGPSSLLNSLNM